MAPKDVDIEAGSPPKRAALSNADIIPDAGKVHLGTYSTVVVVETSFAVSNQSFVRSISPSRFALLY